MIQEGLTLSQREVPLIPEYPLPGRDMLANNRVDWQIDPTRCALLIHDAQRYWIARFENPEPLIRNMVRLRESADQSDMLTIFSGARYRDIPERRGLALSMWGPGLGGYPGAKPNDGNIIPELSRRSDDWYIEKAKYSAFFKTPLDTKLKERGIDQLIICGVYCHHGCLLTAADAYMRDIKVFFAIDASADHSQYYHEVAIAVMANLCAQNVLTEDVCALLD